MIAQSLSQSIWCSRLRSIALLLACVFFLSSCTTKVSYRFLDWVIAWSVDDYVDWGRGQQADFDQRIETLLLWHQSTQLSEYSRLLRRSKNDFQQPLTESLLRQRLDEMAVLYANLQQRLAPDVVALMSTLSDRQVRSIEKELNSVTEKMEKKYLHGKKDKITKDRVKGVEKFLSGFVGRLNDQQEAAIQDWSTKLSDSSGAWIQTRKRWAEQFVLALDARTEPGFPEQINRLFVNPQSLWGDEYIRLREENLTRGINLVLALQPTLTEKQWGKLNKEIDQWVEVFDELAAEVNEQPFSQPL